MPRVALPDSCSHVGYLGVSTLHMFKINRFLASSSTDLAHRKYSYDITDDFFMRHTFSRSYWVSLDTGHHRLEATLRSTRLQGLLEVGPAGLLAAMLGDLGVSSLHSTKTMTQFSSLYGASNQPCCLLQCSATTL
jgi:hypothetical protein